MRMLISIVALLIVAFIVMKLAATQLRAVQPAAGPGPAASATPQNAARQAAEQVTRALEQGAAQRPADAASE